MPLGRRSTRQSLRERIGRTFEPGPRRDHGVQRVDKAIAGFRRSGDRADRIPPRTRELQGAPAVSEDELAAIVHVYRHLLEEHRRARPHSRTRRKLETRMAHLSESFEVRLSEAPISERERRVWRDRLHADAAQRGASDRVRQVLFRGSSDSGSELLLLPAADGSLEAVIDGVSVVSLDRADELERTEPGFVFALDGGRFRETTAVPSSALAALRRALVTGGRPLAEHVQELIADGLVDRMLNLTPRGRRVLALDRFHAQHAELAPSPSISLRGAVPARARESLARALVHVSLEAPLPVLRITGSLSRQADPALPRPVVAKASLDVSGRFVRAHAAAATESEAIALLQSRLHRNVRALAERDVAHRRSAQLPEPAPRASPSLSALPTIRDRRGDEADGRG